MFKKVRRWLFGASLTAFEVSCTQLRTAAQYGRHADETPLSVRVVVGYSAATGGYFVAQVEQYGVLLFDKQRLGLSEAQVIEYAEANGLPWPGLIAVRQRRSLVL